MDISEARAAVDEARRALEDAESTLKDVVRGRARQGVPLARLARDVGVSRSTIYKWVENMG